jgi:hypothetical protein
MNIEAGTLESVLEDRKAVREPEAADAETNAVEAADEADDYQEPDDADDASGEALEADDEPADDEPEPVAVVDAPHYWPADKKAEFAKLPADLQALVAEQEAGRVAAVNRAQQEAVLARKAVEAEVAQTQALNHQLAQTATAAQAYHNRVVPELGMPWEQVDWSAWFAEDRATAATFRAQYDAEREEIQRVETAKDQAETLAYRQFLQAEAARLPEVAPDLADPTHGPKRKSDLLNYLGGKGYAQDRIAQFGALDLSLAYKAMQFDAAQANAQALKSAPQKSPPSARPIRPAAAASAPSQSARIRDLEARVAQTGSLDDVLALRRAKRKVSG